MKKSTSILGVAMLSLAFTSASFANEEAQKDAAPVATNAPTTHKEDGKKVATKKPEEAKKPAHKK